MKTLVKLPLATLLSVAACWGTAQTLSSIRGSDVSTVDQAPEIKNYQGSKPGGQALIQRTFAQQPPLIPHTTKGYIVSMSFNKCLDCHAWSRAKESGATRISVTHFRTREGVELSSISPNRYFCNQCHVPQSDAPPLVGNTFKPGAGLR